MSVWDWHSPIAWAIFLVACGVTVVLLTWALKTLTEAGVVATSIPQKKK